MRFRLFEPIQVLNAKVLWLQFADVIAGVVVASKSTFHFVVSRCPNRNLKISIHSSYIRLDPPNRRSASFVPRYAALHVYIVLGTGLEGAGEKPSGKIGSVNRSV